MTFSFVSCDPSTMQKVLDTVGDAPLSNLDISMDITDLLIRSCCRMKPTRLSISYHSSLDLRIWKRR